jgi:uncharacterized Zn finger protein
MSNSDLICDRCSGAMIFHGRISLPRHTIYRCENCGNQRWTAEAPPPHQPQSVPVEQPQAQQQQQQQLNSEKE